MKSRESLLKLKRFHVEEKRRQLAQIEGMIDDFQTMADELDAQILSEQKRTGIEDIDHFAYSTFAKAARQRRENLMTSVADLDHQLTMAQDVLSEAIEDLKKVETLAERDSARARLESDWAEQDELDEIAIQRHNII
ncbi:MAG: flagellar export protein FliJ [Hyphomicrobiales bacterium]|nr:flagellar export protein FliJ [Hyphomicrobiales bacterium]PCJ89138.1 MAG: flagellar export protein FliJ [Hyphomicrobiales bacterium]